MMKRYTDKTERNLHTMRSYIYNLNFCNIPQEDSLTLHSLEMRFAARFLYEERGQVSFMRTLIGMTDYST